MQTLSSKEEQDLLSGVKEAVDYVDRQGFSPNQALVKVAQARRWSPGLTRSAVNAFNNGRQVAQWRANDNVLDKLASFPLADYESILAELTSKPEKRAADLHDDYRKPPTWLPDRRRLELLNMPLATREKQAAEISPVVAEHAAALRLDRVLAGRERAKKAYELARRENSEAQDRLLGELGRLERYFKEKAAMDRLPLSAVCDFADTYYGEAGRALSEHLKARITEKQAAFHAGPLSPAKPPCSYVQSAVNAAKVCYAKQAALTRAADAVKQAEEDYLPFVSAPSANSTGSRETLSSCLIEPEKEAALGQWAGGAAVATGTRALLDKALSGAETNKAIESRYADLEEPDHENAIRSIQAQAMLAEMLGNPENPISGYDPDTVLHAYNEIAQLAPRLATQPAAMQPLLSKRLSGHTEPFEVREIADLEKGLKELKRQTSSTNLLGGADESKFFG